MPSVDDYLCNKTELRLLFSLFTRESIHLVDR